MSCCCGSSWPRRMTESATKDMWFSSLPAWHQPSVCCPQPGTPLTGLCAPYRASPETEEKTVCLGNLAFGYGLCLLPVTRGLLDGVFGAVCEPQLMEQSQCRLGSAGDN